MISKFGISYPRLGAGFIHGDPHPGNIFVQPGAKVALIDCGQVKQISSDYRLKLAEAILLVNEWVETGGSPELIKVAQEKMAGESSGPRTLRTAL